MPGAERDEMGRTLWAGGVDPEYLHSIEETVDGLRRLPKRVWAEARIPSGAVSTRSRRVRFIRLRRRKRAGAESSN
jgi:hypothetical protein